MNAEFKRIDTMLEIEPEVKAIAGKNTKAYGGQRDLDYIRQELESATCDFLELKYK